MSDEALTQPYDRYIAALTRVTEAQQHWNSVRLPIRPLPPDGPVPRIPPEQIDAEAELEKAWEDYELKRDAYYQARDDS